MVFTDFLLVVGQILCDILAFSQYNFSGKLWISLFIVDSIYVRFHYNYHFSFLFFRFFSFSNSSRFQSKLRTGSNTNLRYLSISARQSFLIDFCPPLWKYTSMFNKQFVYTKIKCVQYRWISGMKGKWQIWRDEFVQMPHDQANY